MGLIENLEAMLAQGQDSAVLRFGLGNAYLAKGDPAAAAEHLRAAVAQDPEYSAAWKALGTALAQMDQGDAAADAYRRGIDAADKRGDVQGAKEMRVFLRRLQRFGGQPE